MKIRLVLKKLSFKDTSNQTQDNPNEFGNKISEGKKSLVTKEFMIIARIESFILDKGVDDAIYRASIYISNGADGIMIHSKSESTNEILSFCKRYEKFKKKFLWWLYHLLIIEW